YPSYLQLPWLLFYLAALLMILLLPQKILKHLLLVNGSSLKQVKLLMEKKFQTPPSSNIMEKTIAIVSNHIGIFYLLISFKSHILFVLIYLTTYFLMVV